MLHITAGIKLHVKKKKNTTTSTKKQKNFTVRTLLFLPLFDDYPIRALEIDKRICIFIALSNCNADRYISS